MKFSENWLRTFVDPPMSGHALADGLTMAGVEVESLESVGADQLITIKPTPNRGDCLSVWGVAREVAAMTGSVLTPVKIMPVMATTPESITITLEAPAACPRYCGRILRDVDTGAATPPWMVERLESSGLRSISAVVDVMNYVMLELGQPLHAFDRAGIEGGIQVRFGRSDEKIKLLNEQEFALDQSLLVIADQKKPLALAGIMGGMDSAVTPRTKDIVIESAFFDPAAIAGRSRALGFGSDSSYRFERGVDFAMAAHAMERATALVLKICGGKAGPICEASAALPKRPPVQLRRSRVERLLGIALDNQQITNTLQRLQFSHQARGDEFTVTPPSYRFDLVIEEDLIEEVARVYGYDKIPATQPRTFANMLPATETRTPASAWRAQMMARDYQEIIAYSFVDRRWEEDFCSNANPVTLVNPIAAHMDVMRSSLIAGLVDCLKLNLSRQQDRLRLFEIGRCFEREGADYRQPVRIAALAYGGAVAEQWGAAKRRVDFYDVKGDLAALLAPRIAQFESAQHPALHPARAAQVIVDGTLSGWLGELHPRLQQKYDLPFAPTVFELNLDAIAARRTAIYHELSRLPIVRRDISVEVAANVTWDAMLIALKKAAPPAVSEIALFDMYRGKGIDSDKKSVAFRVLLQDTSRTLTDAEIEVVRRQLIQILEEEFDATLRK